MNKDIEARICPVIHCAMPLTSVCEDGDGFENECYDKCPIHGIIKSEGDAGKE